MTNSTLDTAVTAQEALRIVLDGAAPNTTQSLPLAAAAGRILASDVASLRTQPPFDASAMDGYGVRQSDLATLPVTLKIVGEAAAGHPWSGSVSTGEAVRIFTGAQVPGDCDTIIIQENTNAGDGKVEILQGETTGRYIRSAGLDFAKGEVLLKKGEILNPPRLALAASMNHPEVPVYSRPKVAVIATGDELVLPGNALREGQIIASNSFGLAALAQSCGGEVLDMGIALDTSAALEEKCAAALNDGADVIITMGGASVGDHDLVLPTLQGMGFEFVFSKILMKPGKPFLFGTKSHEGRMVRVLGLAGNPVSSMIAGQVFAKPLIRLLAGFPFDAVVPQRAILASPLPANGERQEYMRGTYTKDVNGRIAVSAFDSQDSSMLANLTRADCLIVREIQAPALETGEECRIIDMRSF